MLQKLYRNKDYVSGWEITSILKIAKNYASRVTFLPALKSWEKRQLYLIFKEESCSLIVLVLRKQLSVKSVAIRSKICTFSFSWRPSLIAKWDSCSGTVWCEHCFYILSTPSWFIYAMLHRFSYCALPVSIQTRPKEGKWKLKRRGGLKAKFFKGKYETKLEFPGV